MLVLADVPGWAWDMKAQAYRTFLADRFDITLAYQTKADTLPAALEAWRQYDLVHAFEVSQTGHVPAEYRAGGGKFVAGLTAHVWRTWGAARMHAWAALVDALHGNSLLLAAELRQFHPRVYYTPNGVDPTFWTRTRPRATAEVVACHVGKPNPRKGAHLIIEACDRVGLKLLLCQRTAHIRKTPLEMREEFYQDAWVQVTASDMDGTPNPMLESAACGNALLSTRIGNMPEVIRDGRNGWLVERDAEALADRLAWMKDHPAEVAELGDEARDTILRDWTWSQQVDHVAAMWRAVLA